MIQFLILSSLIYIIMVCLNQSHSFITPSKLTDVGVVFVLFWKPLDLKIAALKPSSLSSLLTDSVLPEGGDWGLLLLLSPFPLLLPPSLFLLSVLLLHWRLLPPSHFSGFYGCVSLLPAELKCYLFLLFCCFSLLSVIFLWKFCNFIFCLKFLSFLCVCVFFFPVD